MTRMSRTERDQLCDLALEVGGDAPTLSGEWTVKDLVVHLLVREGSPAAVGITVPQLAALTDKASARIGRAALEELVARLRKGPPRWSPFALPPVDAMANTLEFFVHHEDIRRARAGWEPRTLTTEEESTLWRLVRTPAKGLVRRAPVGVVLERTDVEGPADEPDDGLADDSADRRAVVKNAPGAVTVRGLPSELVLYVFGRTPQARVELDGAPADVEALRGTSLGI